ncbi:MAG: hypothetical protein K2L75_03335 [Muribaculaceae bacterium]|nr:hypothetical protein [Muribaculaceae bacterium]
MKFRNTTCARLSVNYSRLMSERRHIAQEKCERCGRELSMFGRLYHILPAGEPSRNEVDNLRYLCNSCYKAVARHKAPLDIKMKQEGGEA